MSALPTNTGNVYYLAPEGTVVRHNGLFGFGYSYSWAMPDGSFIDLAPTELRFGVAENYEFFDFNGQTVLTNVSILNTPNTRRGLLAFGLIREETPLGDPNQNTSAAYNAGFQGVLGSGPGGTGLVPDLKDTRNTIIAIGVVALIAYVAWKVKG